MISAAFGKPTAVRVELNNGDVIIESGRFERVKI
jgi:hypothetical protein